MSTVRNAGTGLRWLFRLAVRTYPAEFRDRFGPSMCEAFDDVIAEAAAGGRIRLFREGLRAVASCLAGGIRERITGRYGTRSLVSDPGTGKTLMEGSFRDLRLAVRSLVRRPSFTFIAVSTLALGIGANAAIFSVVDGLLLRPLPYVDPDGLVMVWRVSDADPGARNAMSFPDIEDVALLPAFESLVGVTSVEAALTGFGEPRVVSGARVTDGLLSTFRLTPILGRDLNGGDGAPGAAPVVVVSHGFWMTVLGGRRDVVGLTLQLNELDREVVGVAPAGFGYPQNTQFWVAWTRNEGCARGCHGLRPIGRLAADASVAAAHEQASALGLRLAEAYPRTNTEKRFRVISLADEIVGDVRAGLWALLGAATIVLLIACANAANLLLARAANRQGEVAIRAALGASRGRLLREILAESFVLALAGTALGAVVAAGLLSGLHRMAEGTLPRMGAIAVNGRVLLFIATLCVSVALVSGLSPALRLARGALRDAVTGTGKGVNRGPGERRYRASLLAGEVALSVLLLVGAGLLLRTFVALTQVPLGFDGREVVRFTLSLPYSRYAELDRIDGFFQELETRIGELPDVESVGSVNGAPFARGTTTANVYHEGRPDPSPSERTDAGMRSVTAGYLETMGIPVLKGRGIERTDRMGSMPVAVVNEAFVRENFPVEDPLGQRFTLSIDFGFGSPVWEIVGVVGDVRSGSVTTEPRAEVYVPLAHTGVNTMMVHVRGRRGAAPLLDQLRAHVLALDANLPLASVETVTEAVGRAVAPTRFFLLLIGGFAMLAVVLAAVGLYGVVSYDVAQRTREIGLRMALGAQPRWIVRTMIVEGLRPAVVGILIGLGAALATGRVLESLLFQIHPRDPLTFLLAPALLVSVVGLASLVPAWRAARVDPVSALRQE